MRPRRIESLLKGRRPTKPLIAAVEGPAIAGGTEILQATDIRVAGESAKFGVTASRGGDCSRSVVRRSASSARFRTRSLRTSC